MNSFQVGYNVTLISSIDQWWKTIPYACLLDFLIKIAVSISTYFTVKISRSLFFYTSKLEEKNKWYENILDNMSAGFVHIGNNKKIKFVNRFISDHFAKKDLITTQESNCGSPSNFNDFFGLTISNSQGALVTGVTW